MNNYKMVFTPKQGIEIDREAACDKIDSLLNAMQKNGQILGWYDVTVKGNKCFALFSAYDKNGLDEKYYNEYVASYYNELAEMFDIRLKNDGLNLEYSDICTCKFPSWRYLQHAGNISGNSIVCGDCGDVVPVYQLPKNKDEKEYYDLINWENGYLGVEFLWFYGSHDAFMYKQMSSPTSKLSKHGRSICRKLEKSTGIPFYYYIHYYNKQFVEDYCNVKVKHPYDVCPVCGEKWEREKRNSVYLRCHKCRLFAYDPDNKQGEER